MKISSRLCFVVAGGGGAATATSVVVIVVRQCYTRKAKTKHIHTRHNKALLIQKIRKSRYIKVLFSKLRQFYVF